MNYRTRWRGRTRRQFAQATAICWAIAMGNNAQGQAPLRLPAIPGGTFEDRPVATELSESVKRMIDAARRLNEQPGLILNRKAIYATLEARPGETATFRNTEGSRNMADHLVFEKSREMRDWQVSLLISEPLANATWTSNDRMTYQGRICYPSTLVEAYWGKPFVYRPQGVYSPRRAGPHDGVPYPAGFWAPFPNSANVTFYNGRGGCLTRINVGQLFNHREYSDDGIYYE